MTLTSYLLSMVFHDIPPLHRTLCCWFCMILLLGMPCIPSVCDCRTRIDLWYLAAKAQSDTTPLARFLRSAGLRFHHDAQTWKDTILLWPVYMLKVQVMQCQKLWKIQTRGQISMIYSIMLLSTQHRSWQRSLVSDRPSTPLGQCSCKRRPEASSGIFWGLLKPKCTCLNNVESCFKLKSWSMDMFELWSISYSSKQWQSSQNRIAKKKGLNAQQAPFNT